MSERTHTRRAALTRTAVVAGTALGTAAVAACATRDQTAPSAPRQLPKGTPLATTEEVPVGSAASVTTEDGQEVIVSRRTADEVAAFSAVCTHQGCTVRAERSRLHCPCHNSVFDPFTGAAREGPARAPLPAIDVRMDGDRIVTA